MSNNDKKTETAQEILNDFKIKFMVAITVIFFGSMVAAFIWLFIKSSLWNGVYSTLFNFFLFGGILRGLFIFKVFYRGGVIKKMVTVFRTTMVL